MRQLPPLAAVRAFEAAARHQHFTAAAGELGMTQAAVSYQIKLLEERLGAPLFVRSGRRIALSDLGRRIAPQVTGAFDALGDAFAAARAASETVLTISAPRTFATNWLARRLGSFQLARSPLAVRLDVNDAVIDLASGEVDVAIRGADDPWPGLVSHFLMAMPVAPFASPSLLARYPAATAPAEVMALPRLSPDDDWWHLWFDSLSGIVPEAAPTGVRFESQILDGNAAIAGHGVAVLSAPMWRSEIAAGQLVPVHQHQAMYRNGFWLVYPEAKRRLAKVRAFRDWLLAEIRADVGDEPEVVFAPPAG